MKYIKQICFIGLLGIFMLINLVCYNEPALAAINIPKQGSTTYGNNQATIDVSNASSGYCMIKYTGKNKKIKIQISKEATTYTYNLNAVDAYEIFPLTEGDGSYSIKVYENVSGNQYALIFGKEIIVSLINQYEPFLYPNQYVNFDKDSEVVKLGNQLAAGFINQIDIVNSIYNYVVDNFTYDMEKAKSVQSDYLPNIDQILTTKKGICFDYASVMTALLRSQNIPTKLVVGYAGNIYHAWVDVYIKNIGWINSAIYFDGTDWKLMDPTFASTGKQNKDINLYIENDLNYKAKYAY